MTDDERLAAIKARNAAIYEANKGWIGMSYRDPASAFPPLPPSQKDADIRYLVARVTALDALADAVLAGRWMDADEIARKARGG